MEGEVRCFISKPHTDEESGLSFVTVAVLRTTPEGSLVRWILPGTGVIAECVTGDNVEVLSDFLLDDETRVFVVSPVEVD